MQNRKKIAFVIHSLGRGGAEKVVSELSLYFAAQGHVVTLLVFDGRNVGYPYGGQLLDLDVPSGQGLLSRSLILLKRAWRLRAVYRQAHFDQIIAVMESASFPSLLVNRGTIASNHCNPDLYFSRMEWLLSRYLFPRAAQVICVSKAAEQVFRARLPARVPLGCIYNPVDLPRLHEFSTRRAAVGLEGKYIIAVGRLETQKRVDRLLAAYAHTRLKDEAKLLVLGEGSLRPALEAQVKQLGLQGRVLMPGNVANPHPDVLKAEFLVLSSDHEGFPMVLIEALALGRAVIATDCATGPNEIIEHEQNGLLVPVDDIPALAAAMDRLYADEVLQARLARNAIASVAHLSIERIAANWLELSWN